ncbi:MAG: MFS transporter [Austwickia sp.]|nr:MFS transporter [Austwickia sp.]
MAGGVLLQHYWWGSIFMVNLPVVAAALILGYLLLPESRDHDIGRFDLVGGLLSVATIGVLVYTVIEAPVTGWGSRSTLLGLAVSVVLLGLLLIWEWRFPHPLIDLRLFANPRFTAAATAIAMAFFALFGFVFMITMYFQIVRGYDTLQAGLSTLPYAAVMGGLSPLAILIARRIGTKYTVAGGAFLMAAGLAASATLTADSDYWLRIVPAMCLMAAGMALSTSPSTDSIIGAIPDEKAGLGSAINDTTREVGGALGIAVVGSVMSSFYASGVRDSWAGLKIPSMLTEQAADSIPAGMAIAARLPGQGAQVALARVREAFMDGFGAGAWCAVAASLAAMLVVLLTLPPRDLPRDGEPPGTRPRACVWTPRLAPSRPGGA